MEEEKYFVVSTNEDGDVCLQVLTKEQLLKSFEDVEIDQYNIQKSSDIFEDLTTYVRTYIIKGKLVVPKQVQYSIRYDIE